MERLGGICRLLNADDVDANLLRRMYEERSLLAHGQPLHQVEPERRSLYMQMEALLHQAVKHAILDPDFAAIFRDDESLRARLPLA